MILFVVVLWREAKRKMSVSFQTSLSTFLFSLSNTSSLTSKGVATNFRGTGGGSSTAVVVMEEKSAAAGGPVVRRNNGAALFVETATRADRSRENPVVFWNAIIITSRAPENNVISSLS
jgi:hypothetical protein